MPRLTDYAYLQAHKELRAAWVSDPASFALLSSSEQWDLYGYFCIEHTLSEERLLTYRREVTKVDPSLPQRAGRAVSTWRAKLPRLEAYRTRPHVPSEGKKRNRNYAVTVFSSVQPEIDPQRLVRALFAAFADHETATRGNRRKRRR